MTKIELRVPPEVASALIAHVANHGWDIIWKKEEYESHTSFIGTKPMMERVHSFVSGFKACLEMSGKKRN